MTIKYNDPRIIRAVFRRDPTLAWVIENWDNFTWLQRKQIWLTCKRYYWQHRINELWPKICVKFFDL